MRGKEYWLARLESRVKARKENDRETLEALDSEADNHKRRYDSDDTRQNDYESLSKMELVWRVMYYNDMVAFDRLAELPEFSRSGLFHVNRKHLIEEKVSLNQQRFYGGLDAQEGVAVLGYDMEEDDGYTEDGEGPTRERERGLLRDREDEDGDDPWEIEERQRKQALAEGREPPELLAHDWNKWEIIRDQALMLTTKSIPRTEANRIGWDKKPDGRRYSIVGHCQRYRMLDRLDALQGTELLFELLYRGWLRPEMRRTIEEELLDGQRLGPFMASGEESGISIDEEWLEEDGETLEVVLTRAEVDADGRWQGQWSRVVLEDACLELTGGDRDRAQEIYDLVTAQTHTKELERNGKTQLQAMAGEQGITYDALRKRRERYIDELGNLIGDDPRKYSGTLV